MNSSQQYFLQKKIFNKLNIKSNQLKLIISNKSYLNFLKSIHQFEELCEGLSKPEIETVGLSEFKTFLKQLTVEKHKTVDEINSQRIDFLELSEEDLLERTVKELQEIIRLLKTDFLIFQIDVQRWVLKLYDLHIIEKIEIRNYYLKSSFNLEIENLRNLQLSLHPKIIKKFVENNFKNLFKKIDFVFITVTQLYNFGNQMSNKEVEMIPEEEELFPPGTNLFEQKNTIIEDLKTKEEDLKQKLKSIQSLEGNINEMDLNLNRLCDEREQAKSLLQTQINEMEELLKKISGLEKLTDEIDNRIKNSLGKFNEEIDQLEQRRLAVLADPNLTLEEKEQKLKELNEEMETLKQSYGSELELLTKERDELANQSINFACDIDKSICVFQDNHLAMLEELENKKIGATPSEIEQINREIEAKKKQYKSQMSLVDRSKCRSEYLTDEFGRYFIDECGRQIYKRHSNASEYMRLADGTFKQITEKVPIKSDAAGDYYIDETGEKVYVRQCLDDEHGRFFLDPTGRRIYKKDAEASEYELVDGVMIKVKEGVYEKDEFGNRVIVTPESSESEYEPEPEEADEYIKWAVGRALVPGLASITVNEPVDPINYLSNFLLQYRYNEIQNYEKKKEIKAFLKERKKILERNTDDCN